MYPTDMGRQISDVYLLKSKGIPIGVVEIKVPVGDILSNPKVHGHLYDYLMALTSFSGVQCPFGILTTYEDWRVCWLPETQPLAEAAKLPDPVERRFKLWAFLPDTPQFLLSKISSVQPPAQNPNPLAQRGGERVDELENLTESDFLEQIDVFNFVSARPHQPTVG